jgi:hypothetical protein
MSNTNSLGGNPISPDHTAAEPDRRPTSDLDAAYRHHLDQPGQLRALGAEYDPDHEPAPTVASEQRRSEAFVDDRIGRLRQEGASPETIYAEVRQDLSSALTEDLRRVEGAAVRLAAQGVSKDTLDRHVKATIDASDAVVAGLRDKVFPASRPPEELDAQYRRHLEDPDHMERLGAAWDGEKTIGAWKEQAAELADSYIESGREAGETPQETYVNFRRVMAGRLDRDLDRAQTAADELSMQGVSRDTLDRHTTAIVDASDAVVASTREKLSAPQAADGRETRAASLREQGVPEAAIAAQMRAGVASPQVQGTAAQRGPAAPAQTSRIARLAARVTGRSTAPGSAER